MKTTWDDIRRTVLQKMFFSNIGTTITANDSNKDYMDAMPAVYNEAVMLLSTMNRRVVKSFEVASDGLAHPITVDLRTVVDDLYQLMPDEIYFVDENGNLSRYYGQQYVGDNVMLLDGTKPGTYRIYYNAYPLKATANTDGKQDMQLDPDVAALVPLYMASQLYKDDDVSIATQYRNEFEVGRSELARERNGNKTGEFVSTTGWC